MRQRVAFIVAVGLLMAATAALQPAVSAVVVKGVSCSTCPSGSKWSPKSTSIVHGTKVVWKAINTSHTVTSIGTKWSKNVTINVGQTTGFTFNKVGTFRFRCRFHSTYNATTKKCTGMCGKVIVS